MIFWYCLVRRGIHCSLCTWDFNLFCLELFWKCFSTFFQGLYGLPKRNGKLKDISHFDAAFFGVHPKQANTMDPQLRLMLEIAYEAIVDGGEETGWNKKQKTFTGKCVLPFLIVSFKNCCDPGLNPASLRGSKTGVYIGVSGSEAGEAFSRDPEELLGYSMTGCQRAMLANRLSYFFDFSGTCTHSQL